MIDKGDLSLTVIEAEMGKDESDDEKQDEDEIEQAIRVIADDGS